MTWFSPDSTKRAWQWFADRAHGKHTLAWLIGISFCEPIFLPVMPEALMVPMILAGRERWKRYATISAAAVVAGAIAGYWIGALFFNAFGDPILSFYDAHRSFRAIQALLSAHVFLVMFALSFTLIPNKIAVLLAGFLHLPFLPFIAGFALGRFILYEGLGYLTARFGERAVALAWRYFEWVAGVILLVLALLLLREFHIVQLFGR